MGEDRQSRRGLRQSLLQLVQRTVLRQVLFGGGAPGGRAQETQAPARERHSVWLVGVYANIYLLEWVEAGKRREQRFGGGSPSPTFIYILPAPPRQLQQENTCQSSIVTVGLSVAQLQWLI